MKFIRNVKTRKLGKIGSKKSHSYYVTIPMDYVKAAGWREGQSLTIKKSGRKSRLIIEGLDN